MSLSFRLKSNSAWCIHVFIAHCVSHGFPVTDRNQHVCYTTTFTHSKSLKSQGGQLLCLCYSTDECSSDVLTSTFIKNKMFTCNRLLFTVDGSWRHYCSLHAVTDIQPNSVFSDRVMTLSIMATFGHFGMVMFSEDFYRCSMCADLRIILYLANLSTLYVRETLWYMDNCMILFLMEMYTDVL
jgi:hypothetical protein